MFIEIIRYCANWHIEYEICISSYSIIPREYLNYNKSKKIVVKSNKLIYIYLFYYFYYIIIILIKKNWIFFNDNFFHDNLRKFISKNDAHLFRKLVNLVDVPTKFPSFPSLYSQSLESSNCVQVELCRRAMGKIFFVFTVIMGSTHGRSNVYARTCNRTG